MSEQQALTQSQGDGATAGTPAQALSLPDSRKDTQLAGAVQIESVDDVVRLGKMMAASGFFQDAKDTAKACVKILAGAELGISPVAAMRGVYVFDGNTTLNASLIGALIKRSDRYDYDVVKVNDKGAAIDFYESGEKVGQSTFTWEDAEQAGLTRKQNWKNYPSDMCFARAMTRGARRYCSEVFLGPIYTPDEMGQETDRQGNPIAKESLGSQGQPIQEKALQEATQQPEKQPEQTPAQERVQSNSVDYDKRIHTLKTWLLSRRPEDLQQAQLEIDSKIADWPDAKKAAAQEAIEDALETIEQRLDQLDEMEEDVERGVAEADMTPVNKKWKHVIEDWPEHWKDVARERYNAAWDAALERHSGEVEVKPEDDSTPGESKGDPLRATEAMQKGETALSKPDELPTGFPHREKLIQGGIKTIRQAKEAHASGTLQEVEGIGPTYEAEIAKALGISEGNPLQDDTGDDPKGSQADVFDDLPEDLQ